MSTIAVYIPRVPIFVDKSQIENAFVDMFDDIKVNMDIHTKLDRYATEYQMMFAHLTTTEKTDMESFNTFNTRLKDEEEVWVYYYKDYYFKARNVKKNKNRMMSKGEMENIKKNNKNKTEETAAEETAEETAAEETAAEETAEKSDAPKDGWDA